MHIDPAVVTQLIIAVTTLVTVLAGYISSKIERAANARTLEKKIDDNTAITKTTHDQVNGQTAALLQVTGAASFAAGQKDQLATQNAAEVARNQT